MFSESTQKHPVWQVWNESEKIFKKQTGLEILSKAKRESARRPKSNWEKI